MFETINESNFVIFAAKCYENVCYDTEEFYDDLKRFQYLRRLFGKYVEHGDLRERLILNHIIVIYNVFGVEATRMLLYRLEGFWHLLKPFLILINRLPVQLNDVKSDERILEVLKSL